MFGAEKLYIFPILIRKALQACFSVGQKVCLVSEDHTHSSAKVAKLAFLSTCGGYNDGKKAREVFFSEKNYSKRYTPILLNQHFIFSDLINALGMYPN